MKTAGVYTIVWSNMDASNFSAAPNYSVAKTGTGTLTVRQAAVTPPSGGGSSSGSSDSGTAKVTVPVSTDKGDVKIEASVQNKTAAITVTDQQAAEIAVLCVAAALQASP